MKNRKLCLDFDKQNLNNNSALLMFFPQHVRRVQN